MPKEFVGESTLTNEDTTDGPPLLKRRGTVGVRDNFLLSVHPDRWAFRKVGGKYRFVPLTQLISLNAGINGVERGPKGKARQPTNLEELVVEHKKKAGRLVLQQTDSRIGEYVKRKKVTVRFRGGVTVQRTHHWPIFMKMDFHADRNIVEEAPDPAAKDKWLCKLVDDGVIPHPLSDVKRSLVNQAVDAVKRAKRRKDPDALKDAEAYLTALQKAPLVPAKPKPKPKPKPEGGQDDE